MARIVTEVAEITITEGAGKVLRGRDVVGLYRLCVASRYRAASDGGDFRAPAVLSYALAAGRDNWSIARCRGLPGTQAVGFVELLLPRVRTIVSTPD